MRATWNIIKAFVIGAAIMAGFLTIATLLAVALGAAIGAVDPNWLDPTIDYSWTEWVSNRVILGLISILVIIVAGATVGLGLSFMEERRQTKHDELDKALKKRVG